MNGALEGIKIVEVASYVTGPFAAQLLADMAAEVVKIEEPKRGDPFRGWGERNYAATFCSLNRNKKSVTLDLRTDEGRDIALKLMGNADVVIQNFRPGVMDKRGLGYDHIKKINPKIVYCSISGFGPKGPYRDMPGYDTVGQARSGLLSLLTDPGKPQGMGISFSDHLTGMYACYGVWGALMNRMLTNMLRLPYYAPQYLSSAKMPRATSRPGMCQGANIARRRPVCLLLRIETDCPSFCICHRPTSFGWASLTSLASRNGPKMPALIIAK